MVDSGILALAFTCTVTLGNLPLRMPVSSPVVRPSEPWGQMCMLWTVQDKHQQSLCLLTPCLLKVLCKWILSVKKNYRKSVAYHNWRHAFNTAQCMFAALKAGRIQVLLRALHAFETSRCFTAYPSSFLNVHSW